MTYPKNQSLRRKALVDFLPMAGRQTKDLFSSPNHTDGQTPSMSLLYAFRIHLAAFAVFLAFAIFGLVVGPERANTAVHTPVPTFVITAAMWAWLLSWLWLLIQSWVMLVRSWKTRGTGENTKLFLILFFFNFFGAYYFYWKRFEIDPKVV